MQVGEWSPFPNWQCFPFKFSRKFRLKWLHLNNLSPKQLCTVRHSHWNMKGQRREERGGGKERWGGWEGGQRKRGKTKNCLFLDHWLFRYWDVTSFPAHTPSSIFFYFPFLPSFIETYTICWTTLSLSSKGWQRMWMFLATVPPPSINVWITVQAVKIRLKQKDPMTVLLGSLYDLPATFSFVSLNEVGVRPCCMIFSAENKLVKQSLS